MLLWSDKNHARKGQKMIISRCCKASLVAMIDHYTCTVCHRACDALYDEKTEKTINEAQSYADQRRKTDTQSDARD